MPIKSIIGEIFVKKMNHLELKCRVIILGIEES